MNLPEPQATNPYCYRWEHLAAVKLLWEQLDQVVSAAEREGLPRAGFTYSSFQLREALAWEWSLVDVFTHKGDVGRVQVVRHDHAARWDVHVTLWARDEGAGTKTS